MTSQAPDAGRVAFFISTADVGGAETQLVRLAGLLKARGSSVTVYFLAGAGPLTARLDAADVPWQVIGALTPARSRLGKLREAARLAIELRRFRPDIAYAWLPGVIWVTMPIVALTTRAKRVAAFRGLVQTFEVRTALRRFLFRWAVRTSAAVVANAPSLVDDAVALGARSERVHFIPNGVELPQVTADSEPQPPRAVVVANFHPYKGHELVVECMARVPEFDVAFLGTGPMLEEVRRQAQAVGVEHRIEFVGQTGHVSQELTRSQFAIHPSWTEGMSNAVLEEMAHGLPVVATSVGATPLLVDHEKSGFLVDAGDLESLQKYVERMATSPSLRTTMGTQARRKAESFSWQESAAAHERLFHQIRGIDRGNT